MGPDPAKSAPMSMRCGCRPVIARSGLRYSGGAGFAAAWCLCLACATAPSLAAPRRARVLAAALAALTDSSLSSTELLLSAFAGQPVIGPLPATVCCGVRGRGLAGRKYAVPAMAAPVTVRAAATVMASAGLRARARLERGLRCLDGVRPRWPADLGGFRWRGIASDTSCFQTERWTAARLSPSVLVSARVGAGHQRHADAVQGHGGGVAVRDRRARSVLLAPYHAPDSVAALPEPEKTNDSLWDSVG